MGVRTEKAGTAPQLAAHFEAHRCFSSRAQTFLEVNGKAVYTGKKINSTTMMFTLVNVQTPSSIVSCKLNHNSWNDVVSGLDLNGGRRCIHVSTSVLSSRFLSFYIPSFFLAVPPDKPQNVRCETWRSSRFLECSWERGRETHLSTTYNVSIGRCGGCSQCLWHQGVLSPLSLQNLSVARENGTRILLVHVKRAETVKVPRSAHDEHGTYQVNVTAYNHFGFEQSDPVSFCLKDMGEIYHLNAT